MGIDNDFAINETSALVASPFVNFNSSKACSLVNPLLVICFIASSENEAVVVVVVDDADRFWWLLSAIITRRRKKFIIIFKNILGKLILLIISC